MRLQMPRIPHHDIAEWVNGEVFGGVTFNFTVGGNIIAGAPDDDLSYPKPCMFFYVDGGLPPVPYMGTNTNKHEPMLVCEIIGERRDEYALDLIATDVREHIHGSQPTGYTVILADRTLGTRLRDDAQNRHRRQLIFRCLYDEVAS
jgi:hypothetical protein